jgi:hypothetical protein
MFVVWRRPKCPETEENSVPNCCNFKEGRRPHPSNYQGCSIAKGELQRRKPLEAHESEFIRKDVYSSYAVPGHPFAASQRQSTAATTAINFSGRAEDPASHAITNIRIRSVIPGL